MAYRQEAFLPDTIAAALAQDHPGLEILLSDDCSPDGSFAVMERMAAAYDGPHRIVLNRNPQNLGLIGHVNRLFDLASGDYLIYNAGDDLSEPQRARALADLIAREAPLYLHSNVTDLNPDGSARAPRDRDLHDRLMARSLPDLARAMSHGIGATACWHRSLFDRFGPITETNLFEDRVMLFRARLIGGLGYVDAPLVRYRRGIGLSAGKQDPLRAIEIDLATLRQRRADCLRVAPHLTEVLRAIDRKTAKRLEERARLTG